jgi:hypothetical protein
MNDDPIVEILTPWERRHPRPFAGIRIVAGVSLLIVAPIALSRDVWWGAAGAGRGRSLVRLQSLPSSNPRNGESTDAK